MKRKRGRPVTFNDPFHITRRVEQQIYDRRVAKLKKQGMSYEDILIMLSVEKKERARKKWEKKAKQVQETLDMLNKEEEKAEEEE